MGWEPRSGRLYFYRKLRVGKRVVSQYWGKGPDAEVVSGTPWRDPLGRTIARENEQAEQMELEALESRVAALHDRVALLLELTMRTSGFREHRGQWRRTRRE